MTEQEVLAELARQTGTETWDWLGSDSSGTRRKAKPGERFFVHSTYWRVSVREEQGALSIETTRSRP